MSDQLLGPALFMKVGVHANENLDSIVRRKQKEIAEDGFAMWGYGGNTCHPLTMVRPFAESHSSASSPIRLVMEEMESRHFAEPVPADEYTIDGSKWISINTSIHRVLGSRFALFIKNLRKEALQIDLNASEVAVGPNKGRLAAKYLRGQVDKACLICATDKEAQDRSNRAISLVADIVSPFAAVLRNRI